MNTVNEIINSIETLLKSHTGYKISKDSGVPYQTVQDLKTVKRILKMHALESLRNYINIKNL